MAQTHLSNRGALLSLLPLVAIAQAARKLHGDDIPLGRCLRCKDRPAFVTDPDPYDPPDRRAPLPTAADLAACACGWQPIYIATHYTNLVTGETWTTAETIVRAEADRALVAEIGWAALIERERQHLDAWRAAHAAHARAG